MYNSIITEITEMYEITLLMIPSSHSALSENNIPKFSRTS